MSAALILTLALLGACGGFLAGLLGLGGGVLMFPLLYYMPPLLGLERLDAQMVAAVVVSQVFFSALVGGIAHLRGGRVHRRMVIIAGTVSALGAFGGAVASKWTSEQFLLLLFGIVTILVILMTFLPAPTEEQEKIESVETVRVPTVPLAVASFVVGVIVGFLGAGNFVFVPLLIYVLKMPTRIAIGSNLFIAVMSTATGFIGKLVTGQMPLLSAAVVVFGSGLGALIGEKVHRQLSTRLLRFIYTAIVTLIAMRVWMTILGLDD
jgi:uncharacterized membrane protein YfcA